MRKIKAFYIETDAFCSNVMDIGEFAMHTFECKDI